MLHHKNKAIKVIFIWLYEIKIGCEIMSIKEILKETENLLVKIYQ